MLIRLSGCTGWTVPLLFPYGINRFSHDMAHIGNWPFKSVTTNFHHKRLSWVFVDHSQYQPETHYQLESYSWKADNGEELILRAMTKTPCYNSFLYFKLLKRNSSAFIFCHHNQVISCKTFWLTSHVACRRLSTWAWYPLPIEIHDFRLSACLGGLMNLGRLITKGWETHYHIYRLRVITSNIVTNRW